MQNENIVTFKERFSGRDIQAEVVFLFSDREDRQIENILKNIYKATDMQGKLRMVSMALILFQLFVIIFQILLLMTGKYSSGVSDIFMGNA